MQGMCAAHWQAALAAVAASGGMSAAVAAAEAIGRLLLVDALFSALALVAAECPAVVGAPFQALVQEACSPSPSVSPCFSFQLVLHHCRLQLPDLLTCRQAYLHCPR